MSEPAPSFCEGRHQEDPSHHPLCDSCWFWQNAPRPMPSHDFVMDFPERLAPGHREWESCCWCGDPTFSGIYVHREQEAPPKKNADDGRRGSFGTFRGGFGTFAHGRDR